MKFYIAKVIVEGWENSLFFVEAASIVNATEKFKTWLKETGYWKDLEEQVGSDRVSASDFIHIAEIQFPKSGVKRYEP